MDEKPLEFLTFWAINAPLDETELCRQLDAMQALGFTGTVFHPRNYPGNPPYLSLAYLDILSKVILHAKRRGMAFWLYDENGWPSGRAGGLVLTQLKDCRCEWLTWEQGAVQRHSCRQVNTLDAQDMACFVRITYDRYRTGLDPEAFDWVTGFFSDEVGFLDGHGVTVQQGGVPWHRDIGRQYQALYGEPLEPKLDRLFRPAEDSGSVRARYWEIAADLLAENFYDRIDRWCRQYGKRYTAHLKGEENLFFQIPYSGSVFRCLRRVNTPAVDALGRQPGNAWYPRIAASLARQYGSGHCLVEALGGSGWGLTPADVERYIAWLAGCGIRTFVFHISQYVQTPAAAYDWPPDLPFGVNWRQAFPALLSRVQQTAAGYRPPDLLLVAPMRQVQSLFCPAHARQINEHDGSHLPGDAAAHVSSRFTVLAEWLHRRGIDFDVAEEWMIEQDGVQEATGLRLGRALYRWVIFGADCLWQDAALHDALCAAGVGCDATQLRWTLIDFEDNQLLDEVEHRLIVQQNGHILVHSTAPWRRFGSRQRVTTGPFVTTTADDLTGVDCTDLLAAGFPFLAGPVTVESTAYITPDGRLCLGAEQDVQAAAAFVAVDGQPLGWCWAPDWSVTGAPAGFHQVQVRLYPSTYNSRGPHHYNRGDHGLISPDQFWGKRNFVDPPSAPACTETQDWHFVRFGIHCPV